ncbi:hypothetical protein MKK55_18040 [Methylobacterium sp. J-059]|uniref:hypothetical protein n=1 Tax=Methylobacterium sp. J-059 TaxID=2836643 RepID=UPI001FBB0698|nr:hypothetical protein [Methylobacterium sp. J-059]MCJ2040834.1 hypothetical protein [Methylobacterium sp. J-059]
MSPLDLARWRAETLIVDALVAALLARDGRAQAAAVRTIPDDDDAHRRVWSRAILLVEWHGVHGAD